MNNEPAKAPAAEKPVEAPEAERGPPDPIQGPIVQQGASMPQESTTEQTRAIVHRVEGKALASPVALGPAGLGLLPVAELEAALTEYDARRSFMRKWLLSHLIEGVHYGIPFGAKVDDAGNLLQWKKGYDGAKGKYEIVDPKKWRLKPTLYKAGALLIIDLLQIGMRFEMDEDYWRVLGSVSGTVVSRCILTIPATGQVIGEGRGVFKVGDKDMDANGAVKMSEKRSAIDAVINAFAVAGELFGQDDPPPAQPAPQRDPESQTPPSRADRGPGPTASIPVAHEQAKALWSEYVRQAVTIAGKGIVGERLNREWFEWMFTAIGRRVELPRLSLDEVDQLNQQLQERGVELNPQGVTGKDEL